MHVQDVDKVELPGLLMELSQLYFEQLGNEKDEISSQKNKQETSEDVIHQCVNCMTVYDETYGDPSQEILPGTPFEDLSEDYNCSICEAPKADFKKKVWVK